MTDYSRRDFLKKTVPVVAAAGLASIIGLDKAFGTVQTAPPSPTSNPTPGTVFATASYIIAFEKTFFAQNGDNGKVDFSGADAATVIQSAVNSLPKGGLVLIRKGVYPMTSKVVLGQGIDLRGEQGAILQVASGAQTSANPFNLLEVIGDNVTIEDLELDGNANANQNIVGTTLDSPPANPNMQSGIVGRSGQNGEISNCYIHDLWNAGIWLAATDGDVVGWEIASCQFERTGKSQTDASSTNPPQSANSIYVFRLSGSTSKSIIHDNVIHDSFGNGVYLHFDSDSNVSDNIIVSSTPYQTATAGIVLDDFVKRVSVRGNRVSGYSPGIVVVWSGCEDIIVEGNSCANAPNAGGSGSGIAVDNGNGGTPVSKRVLVKGNICTRNALQGIRIAASDVIVEGNICYNNNTDSGDILVRRAGILVQGAPSAPVDGVLILGNRCYDDQDVPTQEYGISLCQQGDLVSQVLIAQNDLRGNGTSSIGALDSQSFLLRGNIGYNPVGMQPISVAQSSPFSYQNVHGGSEVMYINGGIVTQILKNNILVFTSSPATVLLDPGDSLTIVHGDPPQVLCDRR